jgi:hypothetical protein
VVRRLLNSINSINSINSVSEPTALAAGFEAGNATNSLSS